MIEQLSGVLSTLNDLSGEYEQLLIIIEKYNYEDCDTFHSLLASNLILQRKIKEAMVILNNLNNKMNLKGLKRSYLTPTRVEEVILVFMLSQVEISLIDKTVQILDSADLGDRLGEDEEEMMRKMALLAVTNDQNNDHSIPL
jgi:hypothetical protein